MNRQRRNGEQVPRVRRVDVVEGEGFDVALADLPGAGYTWEPRGVPAGLTLLEEERTSPVPDVVGASQRKVVRFRADHAGDYMLVFTLARTWEDTPTETRTVHVHVGPSDEKSAE